MDDHARISEERRLRAAILRGEEVAWETLHGQSFPAHLAWVRARCGDSPELVEEVVQETWMVAIRRIRDFDPERGSFLAWLRGIAARQLSDRSRYESRRQTQPLLVAPEAAVDLDTRERVGLALSLLTQEQRELLEAKYLERRSVVEIAERTRSTAKSVESMLSRARAAFRAAWTRI